MPKQFITRATLPPELEPVLKLLGERLSFGAVAAVLWALGFLEDLAKIAEPFRDRIGLSNDLAAVKERVRLAKIDNDF